MVLHFPNPHEDVMELVCALHFQQLSQILMMETLVPQILYPIDLLVDLDLKVLMLHHLLVHLFDKRCYLVIEIISFLPWILELVLSPFVEQPFSLHDVEILGIGDDGKFHEVNFFRTLFWLLFYYFEFRLKFPLRLLQENILFGLLEFRQESVNNSFFRFKMFRRCLTHSFILPFVFSLLDDLAGLVQELRVEVI